MRDEFSMDFVLSGTVNGQSITPASISLQQFNEFNRQVETFIGGTQKIGVDETRLEIAQGSYILRAALPAVAMMSLATDLKLLAREDALGELDPKRAEVIEKWQVTAKSSMGWSYSIRPADKSLPTVGVSRDTNFRIGDVIPWVAIEKYVFGQVVDMGGQHKANIHIKLGPSGRALTVSASQDVLRELEENRLYHNALLHIRAEQHFQTGALRNACLIAFVDYQPKYDADAFDRFAVAGAKAWADVPDAAQWVREQRGG
jgi:hypothetical protein